MADAVMTQSADQGQHPLLELLLFSSESETLQHQPSSAPEQPMDESADDTHCRQEPQPHPSPHDPGLDNVSNTAAGGDEPPRTAGGEEPSLPIPEAANGEEPSLPASEAAHGEEPTPPAPEAAGGEELPSPSSVAAHGEAPPPPAPEAAGEEDPIPPPPGSMLPLTSLPADDISGAADSTDLNLEDELEDADAGPPAASMPEPPARRQLGRLKRLDQGHAPDMAVPADEKPAVQEEQQQQQKAPTTLKKRVVVPRSALPDDFLEDDTACPDNRAEHPGASQEQEQDEEDAGYWNEEDEYAKQIMEDNSKDSLSAQRKQAKRKKKRGEQAAEQECSDGGDDGDDGGEAASQDGDPQAGSGDDDAAGNLDASAEQRRLRDAAGREGFGKGFVPEIKPLEGLLAKLQTRAKAVVERAQASAPAVIAPAPQPTIDFGTLMARFQAKGVHARADAATAVGPAGAGANGTSAAGARPGAAPPLPGPAAAAVAAEEDDLEIDDLEILDERRTPAKQPTPHQQGLVLNLEGDVDFEHPDVDPNELMEEDGVDVRPEIDLSKSGPKVVDEGLLTRKLPRARPGPSGRASRFLALREGVNKSAGVVGLLPESLRLELSQVEVEAEGDVVMAPADGAGACGGGEKLEEAAGSQEAEAGDGSGSDEGERVAEEEEEESDGGEGGGQGEGEEEDGGDSSSSEEEEDTEEEQEEGAKGGDEELATAEPMMFEEEEMEVAGEQQHSHVEAGAVAGEQRRPEVQGAAAEGAVAGGGGGGTRRLGAKKRQKGSSRFVEMEAELSDEDGQGGGVSDDEEEPGADEDGMLAELIDEVQEGRRDHSARNEVHKKWEEEQDLKDVRAILHGIRNGFNRNRAGPDEEDGTDLEARRRRAALFADAALDDDIQVAVLPGQLEIVEEGDNQEDEYCKLKHEARKRRRAAGPSGSPGADADVFRSMVALDRTASEVMALMAKKSAQAAAPAAAAALPPAKRPQEGAAGARFAIFGKDVASGGSSGADAAGSSFLGRTATASLHRAASNAASRSFVFGTEVSNSAPGMESSMDAAHVAGKPGAGRPSSFAGLNSIIGRPGLAQGSSRKDSGAPLSPLLLNILGGKALR